MPLQLWPVFLLLAWSPQTDFTSNVTTIVSGGAVNFTDQTIYNGLVGLGHLMEEHLPHLPSKIQQMWSIIHRNIFSQFNNL